ncbi:MAG: hypothetical protein QM737_18940 [Ferruginibacter sp.]
MNESKRIPCPDCTLFNQQHCNTCHGNGWINDSKPHDTGCGMILLIIVGLFIAILPAVAALLSSILLILSIKISKASINLPTFKVAYISAFLSTAIYILIKSILQLATLGMPNVSDFNNSTSLFSLLQYYFFNMVGPEVSSLYNILLHLLCIFLSAAGLRYKMKGYYEGWGGYGRAILTTIFIIIPSLFATQYLIIFALNKYYPNIIAQ